ncbi:MAG: hypothetical protein O2878_06080 [Bacteroidetes bacterium]|nr:hypothetical protein [Bacteroidota bacterium]
MNLHFLTFCFFLLSLASTTANHNFHSPVLTTQPQSEAEDTLDVVYRNNSLLIQGDRINGNLKIYSIIGNKIMDMNIQDFSKVIIPINLERQNIYIIRVETSDNKIFTQKLIAH